VARVTGPTSSCGQDTAKVDPVAGCCIDIDGELWHEPGSRPLCQARRARAVLDDTTGGGRG